MNKKWAIGISVVTLLLLGGGGYAGYRYYQAKQAAANQPQSETVSVERRNLISRVSTTGTIIPINAVDVSSRITARLQEVLVKENDHVTKGQVIATLDAKSLATQRDQARFNVTNTKAKYERAKYLYSIGADSLATLEDAQYAYDTAQSALEERESDLAETTIVAPMDGVVVGKPKTAGTMATAGNDNPTVIMRLADLSTKQIMAKVDETDIGSIKTGQSATFTIDAFPGKTFNARVAKIAETDTTNVWEEAFSSSSSSSSSSTSGVVYYYVTLDVDDPESLLLPGMTAQVDIQTANKQGALSLPIAALKTDSNGSYVMVKGDDGKFTRQTVQTGIYSDEYVEILSGLNEGDEVEITYKTKSSSSKNNKGPGGPPPF